jgi:hypothetical protein
MDSSTRVLVQLQRLSSCNGMGWGGSQGIPEQRIARQCSARSDDSIPLVPSPKKLDAANRHRPGSLVHPDLE